LGASAESLTASGGEAGVGACDGKEKADEDEKEEDCPTVDPYL
jgi:hypothetical protein